MKAVIIGLPQTLRDRSNAHQRVTGRSGYSSKWSVTEIISPGKKDKWFETDCREVEKCLRKVKDDGVYVFAFKSPRQADQDWLRTNVAPFFHLQWLNSNIVSNPSSQDLNKFFADINSSLEHEEVWIENIKPTALESPLLLPKNCFKTSCEDIWMSATHVDAERMESFKRKLATFKSKHEEHEEDGTKIWADERPYHYNWHGPPHGKAPYPRCWKYSFFLDGFHYDVKCSRKGRVSLVDLDGSCLRGVYLNVDPHGKIRPGTV